MSGIGDVSDTMNNTAELVAEEEGNISELLDDVRPNNHGISVDDVLNPDGEDDECTVACTDEYLADNVVHDLQQTGIVLPETAASEDDADEFVEASYTMGHDEQLLDLGNAV